MAEPAVGAVSLLLGIIRKEASLLGGVGADVQFIKEEMESMKSFLAHLSRTGGEHNEQVRAWMDQVRRLALDSSNCIGLYLYRGNREVHRARGRLRRYMLWLPWLLQKMVVQHRAANQLRELKDRARDVGERRSRYAVEVPVPVVAAAQHQRSAATSWAGQGAGGGDDEGDGEDEPLVVPPPAAGPRARGGGAPGVAPHPEDILERELEGWMMHVWGGGGTPAKPSSIAIVASSPKDADALAHQALALARTQQPHFWDDVMLVDIPPGQSTDQPPEPEDILYHVLRHARGDKREGEAGATAHGMGEQERLTEEIQKVIGQMKVDYSIEKILAPLKEFKSGVPLRDWIYDKLPISRELPLVTQLDDYHHLEHMIRTAYIAHLLLLLTTGALAAATAEQDPVKKRAMRPFAARYGDIIAATAKKLRDRVEQEIGAAHMLITLRTAQYELILREVFPITSSSKQPRQEQDGAAKKQVTKTMATGTLSEDQIKELILTAKLEILRELKPDGQGEISDYMVYDEVMKRAEKIKTKMKEQLRIKGIMDRIKTCLKQNTLIILKFSETTLDGFRWEPTRNALRLIQRVAGALIVTTTTNSQHAKEYCYPPRAPIDCSLVAFYHDAVIKLVSQHVHEEDNNNYDPWLLRSILDKCEQQEFCMKIFAHALYANPRRSNEALHKLHNSLQASPKSLDSIAGKMLKFSYNNMSEEYKSCLLYLAIFPRGHRIRRSTLVGRWVVEGLITREDWPTSVRQAERCFDALIDLWLVYPADIGTTGRVMSCMVGDLVHGFIFKMASKQHFVETRLSNHLARHFSIFNDLQLRSSQTIHSFLGKLSDSSKLSLIKVLDLEGCHFGRKGKRYIKGICSQVLLLKYLSLRRTDVEQLPNKINNLHELEVLDIRQTKVRMPAKESLLLLKLKRLLTGHNNTSRSSAESSTIVHVPNKIEKMVNMEVLSNVKARTSQDLRNIGRLWQLRKLGIVIDDEDSNLKNLLLVVSDLHECLQSLSITIVPNTKAAPSTEGSSLDSNSVIYLMRYPPKVLESLSISGTTDKVQLLQLLLAEKDNNQLTKVTLCQTYLSQDDLKVLAKLPKLQCVRLQHKAYKESKLTFKVGEFQHLKYFLVEGSDLTDIIFDDGAAGELEKIVLPLSDGLNLSGVDKLPRLKEIELNGSSRNCKNNSSDINNRSNNINSITAAATTPTADTNADAATPTTDTITGNTSTSTTTSTTSATINTQGAAPTTDNNAATTTNIDATASTTLTTETASTPAATIDSDPTTTTAASAPTATSIKTNTFLSLLENGKGITNVTLRGTMLKEDDLRNLAKKPTIHRLVLLDKSYAKSQLTFNKNEFPKLNILIVECDNMEINFNSGSCPKLQRFVWTFTKIKSISGIDNLPKLKEVEFKGDFVPNEVKESINKLKTRLYFTQYESENQDQAEENPLEEDNAAKFPCFWKKNKV